MKLSKYLFTFFILFSFASCKQKTNTVPVVGFVDAFEDATISQARDGFVAALKDSGFSAGKGNIKIEYRNAQGDIPTLTQIVNYFVSEPVTLLATCTTLSSVTAVQKTKTIPIFEMVSPTPERMNVLDANGKAPANLFGAVEDLQYIDTSFSIIPKVLKPKSGKLVIGMIYNQSEPQSADAMQYIKALAAKFNITLIALPLNSSADAQLVTQSLLNKNIDAFFANPDNTVFEAFETIKKNCDQHNVPIFTSEAGLVKRGAVAAFGADIYQWGYQAGEQAAQYLKTHKTDGLKPEMVKIRKRVYNPEAAKKYNIIIPSNFEAVK
ncbi:putative ABC transport system substrate-binding protein [Mucilaginibacter mallensis]|uniref:Putative ABC transport system substrate-binding protein n=1 Tax=Mucilaginibacter mallensis TaxID=652787 RepID=A0A1H1WWZ3_MUCMA|nr:ABC transporter substrate-binding protein [Mucilaginibacter mallensis]SDT01667.1 putative ABC transport system substrate-binding protein [Mucilaginibacter mallensis]